MVEAIGLGGRAGGGADHRLDAAVAHAGDGDRARRIIGIDADEDPVARIIEPAGEVAEHRADHRRFVPRRHDDGDGGGIGLAERFGAGARVVRIHRHPTPAGAREEQQIDEKVVEAEDAEADRGDQQQFAQPDVPDGKQRDSDIGHRRP